jgi:hypothetical protein
MRVSSSVRQASSVKWESWNSAVEASRTQIPKEGGEFGVGVSSCMFEDHWRHQHRPAACERKGTREKEGSTNAP